MLCIEQYFSTNPDGRCVILFPCLIALLDQWYVEFISDTSIEDSDISIYGGGTKSRNPSKVNILTLNSGRELTKEILRDNDLIIVDECHRAAASFLF